MSASPSLMGRIANVACAVSRQAVAAGTGVASLITGSEPRRSSRKRKSPDILDPSLDDSTPTTVAEDPAESPDEEPTEEPAPLVPRDPPDEEGKKLLFLESHTHQGISIYSAYQF